MASKEKCDVGLVGLGVMGQNLILNMENKGYRVAIHNRTVEKVCPTLSRSVCLGHVLCVLTRARRVRRSTSSSRRRARARSSLVDTLSKSFASSSPPRAGYPLVFFVLNEQWKVDSNWLTLGVCVCVWLVYRSS